MSEDILDQKNSRLQLFPIQKHDIWDFYLKQVDVFWKPQEIDLSVDKIDWETKLTPEQKNILKYILGFFSFADGLVNENLVQRFMNDVQYIEAQFFYGIQIAIENIHNHTYSLLIDQYFQDETEKNKILNGQLNFHSLKMIHAWVKHWIESEQDFSIRLFTFAILEGIMFQGAFTVIFWFKQLNLMPGLCFSNELISRDEGMHYSFAQLLYTKYLNKKINKIIAIRILKEAMDIQKIFIEEMLPDDIQGMNKNLLYQSIQFVADRHMVLFGYEKIYNVQNPFNFMNLINVDGKTNFFEKRVSEYKKSEKSQEFFVDNDF